MKLIDNIYSVKDKSFSNKVDALRYATAINCNRSDIKYYYHNDVWSKFDRSLLGKISLNELYRQRAQQIRDSYDYVILYYSGGCDSDNILKTFLNNNILLDEIVVKWPKKIIGSSIYVPNTVDKTARNFVSEWDFVIEKELKWLAKNHPKIKITIIDYVEDIPKGYFHEDLFLKQNHMHSALNFLRMQTFAESELKPKGRVAGVVGLDKPIICKHKDKAYMYFIDAILCQHPPAEGTYRENFYWSPDFPLIGFEMAHQVFQFFKFNPLYQSLVPNITWEYLTDEVGQDNIIQYYNIIKPVIYPSWNMAKFQAEKPAQGYRADKDFWFYESSEFKTSKDEWQYHYDSQLSAVADKFCVTDALGKKTAYRQVRTPLYEIGNWNVRDR
jgi:hypothetical protein